MRVFFITSKLNFVTAGGSVMDLHLKARGLAELGHKVTVVTAFSEGNNFHRPFLYPVLEERIKRRGLLGIQSGLFSLLRKYEKEADVFYIDGHMFLYGGGLYRLAGGKSPVAAFFNIRLNCWADSQGNVSNPPLYRRIKKSLRYCLERYIGVPIANNLDAFIFNTPMVEKLYHNFGVGKSKPRVVIEDFVATEEIMEKYPAHREDGRMVKIFSTGRMIPEKGFDLIIKAFAKIKDKNRYKVILSGGGPDKERLEKMVEDLNLKPYFEFPGWVEKPQLNKFFQEANIFIFPKWWIEYGSALLTEAMAFGSACIIPGGGALEWLTGGAALTFKNDNIDELSKQIEKLGVDSKLRGDLSKRILVRAKELDYKNLSLQLEKIVKLISARF